MPREDESLDGHSDALMLRDSDGGGGIKIGIVGAADRIDGLRVWIGERRGECVIAEAG